MKALERIRSKLNTLKTSDSQLQVFGAARHQYQLRPCLSEDDVVFFEQQHTITLPNEYRAFLRHLGNGGAGPHYGLFSLKECLSHINDEGGRFSLEQQFPHQSMWNPITKHTGDGLTKEYLAFETEYFRNAHVNGSVMISAQGCGHETLLIVSGSERGHIWANSRVSDGGIYPLSPGQVAVDQPYSPIYVSDTQHRIGFFEWYEHWLDVNLKNW